MCLDAQCCPTLCNPMAPPSLGVSRHTGVEILFLLQGILLTQGPCKIRTNIETIKNIKHALILVSKHFFTPKRAQFLGGRGGKADSRDLARKIKMTLEHYGKLLKKYKKKKKHGEMSKGHSSQFEIAPTRQIWWNLDIKMNIYGLEESLNSY